MSASPQLAPHSSAPEWGRHRSPLAHLLHALNQPLTGLQCSMELAVAGPRPTDHYIRTLREGLELVSRMRVLVEALRELADMPAANPEPSTVQLDRLVVDAVTDLRPVAEAQGVHLQADTNPPLPVLADAARLGALLFRTLDSAISLALPDSEVHLLAAAERSAAALTLSWTEGEPPAHSPCSRPELGLLLAQAGWEQAGGSWTLLRTEHTQTRILRLPLAPPELSSKRAPTGERS